MCVKQSNIAIPDDPFRIIDKAIKIKLINYPAQAVTAPRAKNCLQMYIVEHLLKIIQTLRVRSGKIVVLIV